MVKRKDITINELAELTTDGFTDVMERIHKVQRTVDSHTETLQKIQATMLELAYKYEVRRLEERVAKIEKALGLTKS